MNLIIPAKNFVMKPTENPFRNHYHAEDVNGEFILDQFSTEELQEQIRKRRLKEIRPFTPAFALELSNQIRDEDK